MHWSGKVFVGFVVIGAAAAIVLSARTHQIRTSWHRSLTKQRADYEAGVDVLRKERFQHESAQVALASAKTIREIVTACQIRQIFSKTSEKTIESSGATRSP